MRSLFCLTFLFYLPKALSFPEPGLWKNVAFPNDQNFLIFTKSMYKDTVLSLKIDCAPEDNVTVDITWMLKRTPCVKESETLSKVDIPLVNNYLTQPDKIYFEDMRYEFEYILTKKTESCKNHIIYLEDKSNEQPHIVPTDDSAAKSADEGRKSDDTMKQQDIDENSKRKDDSKDVENHTKLRKKRDDKNPVNAIDKPTTNAIAQTSDKVSNLAKVWKSGYYVFILQITSNVNSTPQKFYVTLSMRGQVGYISAVEWPLLIFYGVMGLIYIIYGVIWLIMLACNWRDIMRLQYWIGGVIVLGMLEKAVFYAEYQSIANTGISMAQGAVVVAEVVSSLKRALARMLVIIVSVGFGIVKPRLGPTFHKVLCVGGLYFVLASIEGSIRSLKPKGNQSTELILAPIPLAVVDASIIWWIFSSLVQTTRQLRLRRNVVKLSLYKHFTNILIFAVIASLIFMIWSIIQIRLKSCLQNWHEIWIDEAFWHLLFSVLLIVIMILWRPSANNQRYAFSPLIDEADEEDRDEDDADLNDAFVGMKSRSKNVNGSAKPKQSSIEDDLKWVEENIPLTLSDKAQTFLDSDEEVETAKYEVSKMQ